MNRAAFQIFVANAFVAVELLLSKRDIRSGRSHTSERKANRIGSVLVADLERIDDIAFRFRHLLAFRVANDAGDVDILEMERRP